MKPIHMGTRELREQIGHRVDAAHFRGEPTIIEKNGEPRAVLISYEEWIALHPSEDSPATHG